MSYPDDALPVTVEIAPGASPAGDPGDWSWADVTSSVSLADGNQIRISEGRGDWGSRVDAGTCSLVFDNTSGDFSARNPLGQWYGQLGRDTPLRVSLRRVEDAFGRTSTSGWGTADSGQSWTSYGAGGTVASTDFTVSGGTASQSVPVANAYRTSWFASLSLLDCRVRLSGVSLPFSDVTGGSVEPGNILLRAQSQTQYYMARVEVTTAEAVVCKLYNPAGTLLASATTSLIHGAAQTLEVLAEIAGSTLSMKVWATGSTEPTGWTVTATDTTLTSPGGIGVRTGVAAGNTNTLPVVASYDSVTVYADLFGGYVTSWPPRWDRSTAKRRVPITARGALYRLQPGRGDLPERSPMRRTIEASSPLAYWPGEDGKDASEVGSAISGHPALAVSGTAAFKSLEEWETLGYTVHYGTAALADLSGGGSLEATVPADVSAATASGWTVGLVADPTGTANLSGDLVLAEVDTPGGTYVTWRLVATTTAHTQVIAYDSSGVATTVADRNGLVISMIPWTFAVWQSGGTIFVGYQWDSVSGYWASGSIAGTLAGVTALRINPTGTTCTQPLPAGHIAVWAGENTTVTDYRDGDLIMALFSRAWTGFGTSTNGATGEAATSRLARLAAEDGISITVPSVDSTAEQMTGWQPIDAPLDLYRECEDADGGVLYERPFRLAYQPRTSRYNQTATLSLDFNSGQVAEPPEPDDDSPDYRNRWTVERVGGSSVTVEADEVAAGALLYDGPARLNLAADSQLPDQASWRLHLTTHDGLRWPRIDLDLAAAPELIDDWLNCRIGSRITATNPPADVAGEDIDVLLEGHTTTLGYKEWRVEANCSPSAPWDIAVVDGEQRVDADDSTLAAELAEGAMTMSLASTDASGVWTTNTARFPMDIRVGGERVTLSAISGSTSPQTATISARGVNGVTRTWPAGTDVHVWQPAVVGL